MAKVAVSAGKDYADPKNEDDLNIVLDVIRQNRPHCLSLILFRSHYTLLLLTAAACAAFVLSLGFHSIGKIERKDLELVNAAKDVQFYGEAMTMSVRMAAFTGGISWVTRYKNFVDPATKSFNTMKELAPTEVNQYITTTVSPRAMTQNIEVKVLGLVAMRGNLTIAQSLILGPVYTSQKALLSQASDVLASQIKEKVLGDGRQTGALVKGFIVAAVVSCGVGFLLFLGLLIQHVLNTVFKKDEKRLLKMMLQFHDAKCTGGTSKA